MQPKPRQNQSFQLSLRSCGRTAQAWGVLEENGHAIPAGKNRPGTGPARIATLILASALTLGMGEFLALSLEPHLRDAFPCRQLRPELGGGFKSNCRCRWRRWLNGKRIWDVAFETDASGHRVTPGNGNRTAAFLGCSFTLGAGVNQHETLPARFAALTGYRCLNLAGSGFGPQQALVEARRNRADLYVYSMLPAHVDRASGSFQVIGTYGRYFPAPGGGTFAERYPLRTWLASFALIRRLPGPSDPDVLIRYVLELDWETSRRLVVVAWPGAWRGTEEVLTRLRGRVTLLEAGDLGGGKLGDGHPTGEADRRVAAWLAEELEIRRMMEE